MTRNASEIPTMPLLEAAATEADRRVSEALGMEGNLPRPGEHFKGSPESFAEAYEGLPLSYAALEAYGYSQFKAWKDLVAERPDLNNEEMGRSFIEGLVVRAGAIGMIAQQMEWTDSSGEEDD